ncbi:MAG: alanine racemase, partial [Clostridiales bacterium 43-6]
VARELNRIGVRAFCVATVSEGIELRKGGVKGEILILGYTHPSRISSLRRYRLIQTVIDYPYASVLNDCKKKIRVHIGIDTGMHRLGERCDHFEQICSIFRMKHLKIEGAFTHLCADDSTEPMEKSFTQGQGTAFFETMKQLKDQGFSCKKVHLQASYGVLNYPELGGDYARIGIALYGLLSTGADTERCNIVLKPVLAVKTRVAAVKGLYCGETAGYGLSFTAKREMKIATVTIGYADGLPRALSGGTGKVLIHGFEAPILGYICMDQTIIDVTDIPDVTQGDIAVVIGKSGGKEITACDVAQQADTIANEVLSRLGQRLTRMVVS